MFVPSMLSFDGNASYVTLFTLLSVIVYRFCTVFMFMTGQLGTDLIAS